MNEIKREDCITITKAAGVLKCNRTKLQEYKAAGCPAFMHDGVHVDSLIKWMQDNNKTAGIVKDMPKHDGSTNWQTQLKMYQALNEKLEYEKNLEVLVNKDDVVQSIQKVVGLVRAYMESKLISELPPRIAGKEANEIVKEMKIFINEYIRYMNQVGLPDKHE